MQQKVKSFKSEFLERKGKLKRIKTLSDSDEFSSPAILKSLSQFRTKKFKKMSEENHILEHIFMTKMDLTLQGKTQPEFKFVLKNKMSENVLTNQNQEFSDNTLFAQTFALVPSHERIFASDNSHSRNILK